MAAIAPSSTANGRQYRRISSAFTRPADTTAYAIGDLVADTVTAASVAPMSFATTGSRPFWIPHIRLHKTTATILAAKFRVHLYSAAPTVATTGDNASYATDVSSAANWIGAFECWQMLGHANGAVGFAFPALVKPDYIGDPGTLYGLIEALDEYGPGSAEVFTATLVLEFLP